MSWAEDVAAAVLIGWGRNVNWGENASFFLQFSFYTSIVKGI